MEDDHYPAVRQTWLLVFAALRIVPLPASNKDRQFDESQESAHEWLAKHDAHQSPRSFVSAPVPPRDSLPCEDRFPTIHESVSHQPCSAHAPLDQLAHPNVVESLRRSVAVLQ